MLGIEFIFPLIAIPQFVYMMGLYGAWGLVFALIVCYCMEDSGLLVNYLYKIRGKDMVKAEGYNYKCVSSRKKRTECIICGGGVKGI